MYHYLGIDHSAIKLLCGTQKTKTSIIHHTKTYNPLVQPGLDKNGGVIWGYWPTEIAHWPVGIWKNWPFDRCALFLNTLFEFNKSLTKHLAPSRQRLLDAMCREVPLSNSLHRISTSDMK